MSQPTLSTSSGWLWQADRDPTASETVPVEYGNFWININTNALFQCTSATENSMQWISR